jgi:hydroxymethylbilane synthase
MSSSASSIYIATRGSALALAQAEMVRQRCQDLFPDIAFQLRIIKTTGDKIQTASLAQVQEDKKLPKGLFTKELEVALLDCQADFAVHSLKDLPTELPSGLQLGAVPERADVRDVLIYRAEGTLAGGARAFETGLRIDQLPEGAVVATSSTRRRAQLLAQNSKVTVPEIRGNVHTRLNKIHSDPALDATILALAGLTRLRIRISPTGLLVGENVPAGLNATVLEPDVMLPCVGQGAIGIEIRERDEKILNICGKLNDFKAFQSVSAERSFLASMGGGCQSPVAAFARIEHDQIEMTAVSFMNGPARKANGAAPLNEGIRLGQQLAQELT